jgi:hypothetical protein
MVARVVHRQIQGVLEQVQELSNALRSVLEAVVDVADRPAHVHTDLVGQLDAIEERLAVLDPGPDRWTSEAAAGAVSGARNGGGDTFVVRSRGDVEELQNRGDESLDLVDASDGLDAMTAPQIVDLVAMTPSKLRPGGRLIIDHLEGVPLIHPSFLAVAVRQSGFSDVAIEWAGRGRTGYGIVATR